MFLAGVSRPCCRGFAAFEKSPGKTLEHKRCAGCRRPFRNLVFPTETPGANLQTTASAERGRPLTAPSGGSRRARQDRRQAPLVPPPSAAGGQQKRERGVSARVVEARLDELRADEGFRSEAYIAELMSSRAPTVIVLLSPCLVGIVVRALMFAPPYASFRASVKLYLMVYGIERACGTTYIAHGRSRKTNAYPLLNTSIAHQNGLP